MTRLAVLVFLFPLCVNAQTTQGMADVANTAALDSAGDAFSDFNTENGKVAADGVKQASILVRWQRAIAAGWTPALGQDINVMVQKHALAQVGLDLAYNRLVSGMTAYTMGQSLYDAGDWGSAQSAYQGANIQYMLSSVQTAATIAARSASEVQTQFYDILLTTKGW